VLCPINNFTKALELTCAPHAPEARVSFQSRRSRERTPLRVKADLFRVDKISLDRLTIFLHEETVTITPLSFSDSRAPARGGCILAQSTNGVAYHLLWDGISTVIQDHWAIIRADNRPQTDKVELDHLTVPHADSVRESQPLREKSA
jgi:hypothetical protein